MTIQLDKLPPERQFDFWLGTWNLTWEGGAGRNTITSQWNGNVIVEQFDGGTSTPLRGMSVSTYNRRRGEWWQTWVDNNGDQFRVSGGVQDGKMVLDQHVPAESGPVVLRMVFYNITADALDWAWQRSEDGGATFTTQWHIHYTREAAAGG